MYNLYLDDVRYPQHSHEYTGRDIYLSEPWKVVRSYKEFVNTILELGIPDSVSFDHDLGLEHYEDGNLAYNGEIDEIDYSKYKEETGYDCAKWLVEYCMDNNIKTFPDYYVHSMNPVGAQNIISYIENFKKN